MATVYSLVCWGGSTGKQITTMDTTANTFTSTNHGLRDATALQFASGTLPTVAGTALALGTTYYAKPHASDANKFYLYYDSGLTSQVDMTGGSVSAYLKSKVMLDYVAAYPTRWSTRIYDGLSAWNSGRSAASAFDTEVCEIGMAWDDYTSGLTINVPSAASIITTKVNGVRSSAHHGGVSGSGYRVYRYSSGNSYTLTISSLRCTCDGFEVYVPASVTGYAPGGVRLTSYFDAIKNVIVKGRFDGASGGYGVAIESPFANAENSLIMGWNYGFYISNYTAGVQVVNCTSAKNAYGFFGYSGANIAGWYYNNIAIGNTTANWQAIPSGLTVASNNAGVSGDTVWKTGTKPTITTLTADNSTFVDYTNNNYRAASVSCPQVDTGILYYGYESYATDLTDAERPNYNNGGSEAFDVGCFEFDNGYGNHPQTQDVTVSGFAAGSRIKIAKQSDGTEIYNSTSPGWPQTTSYSSSTPVYIYIRKGSAATYYHPLKLSATIDPDAGLTYDATGLQQEDIAAHDYSATAVASDWTFNSGTGAITHASGSTRYNVQDLYSWHQDYYDDSSTVDDNPLMNGITSTIFTLLNGGTITDGDLEDLKGGSIEFESGDLWSNLWTTNTMAAAHDVYVVQGTSKYTSFWSSGPIDVLLQVSDAGTLRDSGLVTAYARPWGYTYSQYTADLSGGGRTVAPILTFVDAAITETSSMVSGWTDVTTTFGSTSKDFGDVHGAQTYYCVVDCNSRPLSEVYQRLQYLTRDASAETLNGIEGWQYQSAHTGYAAVTSAPFGTYVGGIFTVAKGVWLDNVPSGDLLNYILTDDAGHTHQNTAALNQSVTISGLTVGSRVQIYDTTNSSELYNDIASTSSVNWEDPSAPVGDRAIRVRIAYVDGATAKNFIESNIGTCGTSSTTKDVTYLASQTNDSVYNANAVDGSTVTGVTFTDSSVDVMNINLSGGTTNLPDLYAAWVYYASTETGIATDIDYIRAIDTANYVYSNLVWKNVTSPSVPLKISGGYAWDSVTADPMDLIDTTGGTIFLAPPHVVSKVVTVTGGNVITGSVSDLPSAAETTAAIFAQAQVTPMPSNVKEVNSYTVDGNGKSGTEWGPA